MILLCLTEDIQWQVCNDMQQDYLCLTTATIIVIDRLPVLRHFKSLVNRH